MNRKNSPGAVAALGRVSGHIAKAVVELRQAARELERVRGLGVMGSTFLHDVGAFKVLEQLRESLKAKVEGNEGLRLVDETPEERLTPTVPIRVPPRLEDLLRFSPSSSAARSVIEQTAARWSTGWTKEVKELDGSTTLTSPGVPGPNPKCPRCEEYLRRGPVGGGHFDWLECEFCAPMPEKRDKS